MFTKKKKLAYITLLFLNFYHNNTYEKHLIKFLSLLIQIKILLILKKKFEHFSCLQYSLKITIVFLKC